MRKQKNWGSPMHLVVNCHNCLTNIIDTAEHLDELQRAASKCLQKAVAMPTKTFSVGSATVFPAEFNLKAGMGAGGITAIVVQVENQKTAYIVMDGNNMVPGLREKILDALSALGFECQRSLHNRYPCSYRFDYWKARLPSCWRSHGPRLAYSVHQRSSKECRRKS